MSTDARPKMFSVTYASLKLLLQWDHGGLDISSFEHW